MFFHLGHESIGVVQIPTTNHQPPSVGVGIFQDTYLYTPKLFSIEPIYKKIGQKQKNKALFTINSQ
jgi:hypothetical protein